MTVQTTMGEAAAPPAATATSWLLVLHRGTEKRAWVLVDGVPPSAKRADVMLALESWRRWRHFAPLGSQRVTLLPFGKWDSVPATPEPTVVTWAELDPGHSRAITLPVPPAEHRLITGAAARSGASLREWALRTLVEAAERVEL